MREVHELRTRKMGDAAVVDAHILVDPMISVSEGHFIAETARARVLEDPRVVDALIHVDPEHDALWRRSALALPPRDEIVARLDAALAELGLRAAAVRLHYLSGGLEVDITLAAPGSAPGQAVDAAALRERLGVKRVGIEWAAPGEAAESGGATGMERPPAA